MKALIETLITGPSHTLCVMIGKFLPNLMAAVFIFFFGILIAWLVRFLSTRLFRLLKIDQHSEKNGISRLLKKAGIGSSPSEILGRVFFWIIILIFSILSLSALKIPAMESMMEKFLLFLPNLFIAAILLFAGVIVAEFLERTMLIMMVNKGINSAAVVSSGIKIIVIIIALAMAVEQLGIAHTTFLIFFSIVFGGVVFALSLAFGLGGKEIAREFLTEYMRKKKNPEKEPFNHL